MFGSPCTGIRVPPFAASAVGSNRRADVVPTQNAKAKSVLKRGKLERLCLDTLIITHSLVESPHSGTCADSIA
eukprot:4177422-Prymnesium_polylepis.1